MAEYQRQTFPFACRGINLSAPVDRLPPTDYRCLDNVRPYGTNRIQGRQGTTQVNAGTVPGGSNIRSLFSFNDSIPSHSSGPAVRDTNDLSPSSANATGPRFIWVTIPQAHPDPQVTLLDIFRWGIVTQ